MTTVQTSRSSDFTKEQRDAIDMRDASVSLSAGAGCGKTFVLTERFLSYFDPHDPRALRPEDLGSLVAITFTDRAAREMRDRIRAKCHERLHEAEPDEVNYWTAMLRSLDAARISTIHAFCASLLRSRAVEAGLDPQFGVLEQAQADTLLSSVVDDELRRLVSQQDPATIDLAARFDLRVLDMLLRGLVREVTRHDFRQWQEVSPDEQVARWHEFYRDTVAPTIVRELATSPAAREVLDLLAEHVPNHAVMKARGLVLIEKLKALAAGPETQSLAPDVDAIVENSRVQSGGGAKVWPSDDVYQRFKAAATGLREKAKAAKQFLAFDLVAAREPAVIGCQLFALAAGISERYEKRKIELNALDFNDLLSRAKDLLCNPRDPTVRERLSSQIHLLLVDEFQDTDDLQVELVKALCGGNMENGKLFFVGDYKQSIYRFRGAKPHVFRELREGTPVAGRLSLTRNFRSQPAILDFVNALFWDDLGDDYEPLRPNRPQVTATPAVEFLWAPGEEADGKSKEPLRRREAEWIARRVRALIANGEKLVWDEEAAARGTPAAREVRAADIAILFRALSDVELYEEALRHYGIDYYVVGGHAFYAQQEIFDVLNLLRVLNGQSDLVSLVGVLRSGMFSLADETIFWLASKSPGLPRGLFARSYPDEISSEQQKRARFAADTVGFLRAQKDRVRVCELIEMALERTGYDATVLGEFMGQRKLANIRKLVEQARTFHRGDMFGLADFINQVAEFVAQQPDEPLAATHSENTDVVRLMTIHQAKGLEFPVVIVPDVDRPRIHRALGVHFDSRLGPLVRLPAENGKKNGSAGYELWRFTEREEEAAELNRLLYVATTRAADYLILSSGVSEVGAKSGPWMELLTRRFDVASGRFVGELSTDESRPVIKVAAEEPPLETSRSSPRQRIDLAKILDEVSQLRAGVRTSNRAIGPVAPNLAARRQYSFSRLAGTLHRAPSVDRVDFDGPASVDGRALGTLVHSVLAVMDLQKPVDCAELVRLHALRHLPEGAAEIGEARAMLERFLKSARAHELSAARENHAEIEFLLPWPLTPQESSKTMIGGFIDRLYQDAAGRWHVLDFKTNRIGDGDIAPLAAQYELQMLVYALATEQIFGSAPVSVTLHFLRNGVEHSYVWDDEARARVIRLVDEAIAAAESALPPGS